jgi:hypothetical protein
VVIYGRGWGRKNLAVEAIEVEWTNESEVDHLSALERTKYTLTSDPKFMISISTKKLIERMVVSNRIIIRKMFNAERKELTVNIV